MTLPSLCEPLHTLFYTVVSHCQGYALRLFLPTGYEPRLPAFLPAADIAGEIEIENRPDFRDVASINDCVILLEGADNSSSPVVQQQPEGKISTRLRSSGTLDQPQQDGTNSRQARALRRLKLATAAAAQFTFDSYTEYIGTVGIEGVLPPAAVETPNTIKQARRSPQSPEWELHLREPHHPD